MVYGLIKMALDITVMFCSVIITYIKNKQLTVDIQLIYMFEK